MRRLLFRTFFVSLTLSVGCAVVVLIARANPAPDRLQAIGFDVCDGEPCWRGIRPGMDLDKVKEIYPNAFSGARRDLVYYDEALSYTITIVPADNSSVVGLITMRPSRDQLLGITLRDLVLRYGHPCKLRITGSPGEAVIEIYFSTLAVTFIMPPTQSELDDRISPELPTDGFYTGHYDCKQDTGRITWPGFTLRQVYEARLRRATGAVR
jgi:hypothetical protein